MVLARKEMFLRPQAFGEDPATVPYQYERADLNLRLLYSARSRERIGKLLVVVLGLNGQNSLLTAPTKSWMRIKRQEGRTKGPSLPLELSAYCPANFHLQILTGLARACFKTLNRCPSPV